MGVYNPKTDASYKKRWKNENIKEYKEAVFDRISELLINRFPEISEETNQEIEDFQKTWKNGKVIAGRQSEEVMVVYQSDTEANAGDKRIVDLMMDWLEFTHPKYIKLKFEKVVNSDGASRKELVFSAPGKNDLQINSIIGARDLKGVRLKDNVSQFLNFEPFKTQIDKTKLGEHVNIDFSELSPKTFTSGINNFQKNKKSLPFYRYRCEDFFVEYFPSKEVPIDYRIEKFFEYFEMVIDEIDVGFLPDVSAVLKGEDVIQEESILYLFSECKKRLPGVDPWEDLFDTIGDLKFELEKCEQIMLNKDRELEVMHKQFAALSGDTSKSLEVSDPTHPDYDIKDALYDPSLDSSSDEFDQIEYDDAVDDSGDAQIGSYFSKKRRKLRRKRWFRK